MRSDAHKLRYRIAWQDRWEEQGKELQHVMDVVDGLLHDHFGSECNWFEELADMLGKAGRSLLSDDPDERDKGFALMGEVYRQLVFEARDDDSQTRCHEQTLKYVYDTLTPLQQNAETWGDGHDSF